MKMKNAKYLRYAFCAMVLLGMGQQASPMKLSSEEKLKLAEKRVEETKQLEEKAKKELNRKKEKMVLANEEWDRAMEEADKARNLMNLGIQAFLDASTIRGARVRGRVREYTEKGSGKAIERHKEALRAVDHAMAVSRLALDEFMQAQSAHTQAQKARRQAKKAYEQAQGKES